MAQTWCWGENSETRKLGNSGAESREVTLRTPHFAGRTPRSALTGNRQLGAVLLGVDGGASKVRVHHVWPPDGAERSGYELGAAWAERVYPPAPEFVPVEVSRQLQEHAAGQIELTAAERQRSDSIVAAIVETVADVACRVMGGLPERRVACLSEAERSEAQLRHVSTLRIGIGMPGRKTADRRGIAVMNHGPRMPDLADRIQAGLCQAGFTLALPITGIGSDGDYGGLGEEYAADGQFRGVANAYYVGGGTGLAEALKLRGRLITMDEAAAWLAKAWQVPSALGPTMEHLASAAGMNRHYWNLLGERGYPEEAALRGDPIACTVLETAALVLAELVFERMDTVFRGRSPPPHRGERYLQLDPAHAYRGVLFERIVLGQQMGGLYGTEVYRPVFRFKLDALLATFIARAGGSELREHYLAGEALRDGLLVPSKLRAAPALGAAIDADRGWHR